MDAIISVLTGLIETITGMVGGEGGFDPSIIIAKITEILGGLGQ